MPRPPSSAGGARPMTSSGRPMTARPTTADIMSFERDPQYTYDQEYDIEEEEEESEDEDVFAFLPPSTADNIAQAQQEQLEQQQHQQYQQEQAQVQDSYPHPLAVGSEASQAIRQDSTHVFANSVPFAPPNSDPTPSYTSHPSYDTYNTTDPSSSLAGSSTDPYTTNPYGHHISAVVESPPSTDSQSHADIGNSYQLRRVTTGSAATNEQAPASARVSRTSTREVLVTLPNSNNGKDKDLESTGSDEHRSRKPRRRQSSATDTGTSQMSLTPSMVDEDGSSIKMEFDFDAIDEEDSPYPEVRASVSNIDDPEMPALTIRMWFVGLLLCVVGSALNVFFNFRSPAPTVVPLALLLISYPMGRFLAFTMPIRIIRIPILPTSFHNFLTTRIPPHLHFLILPPSFSFSLNPGPWNIKEHVLVYIMANVSTGSPYALNALVVSEVFYEIKLDFSFNLVLVLATQLTGFGLAGLCRRFLVWPASMVWPQNLVACTLLNTLHAEEDALGVIRDDGGGEMPKMGISRFRFFMYVAGAAFFWFFLPGFLFTSLSIFSWVCWIAPKNVVVNQLFGVSSGLGMSVFTFDWTQISWIGSPLMVPWWAQMHIIFGFVLFYWILTPILYYSNTWQASYFPISANVPFDRFGAHYDVAKVLTKTDVFNITAYEEYSPLYLPATYAVTYLLAFCMTTCVIVHTILYHGPSLWRGFKKLKVEEDDIHAKLMRNYPEVPNWWYAVVFGLFFSLAIVAVEHWKTKVPIWALLLAVLLPAIYILPSGFIYAMTGQGISLNLLVQIVPGSLLPGNPLANMIFKAYSIQTLSEAQSFTQDLKLGHYIKVPPRATFMAQMVATTLAAFVQVGVKQWIFTNVKDICTSTQKSQLTCPHNQVFFTASAIWGLIGPTRQFGVGSIYYPCLYALIIGLVLPIPFFLLQRRYPKSWLQYISTPVVLNGVSYIPPATGINYSSWIAVGFVFQYWIRKRNFAWWSKFNYVASAALDSGTVLSIIVIFFTLQFPASGTIQDKVNQWWGNSVYTNTADYLHTPLRTAPADGLPWPSRS